MRKRTKIVFGGLAVALALAAAVGTASARRFEFSEQRFLALFRELTYKPPAESGNVIVCDINLEGSFHSRTISKVSGQLIGYITEAIAHHPCRTGEWWMLNGVERLPGGETARNTLPWHVTYLKFIGSLPRITGIEIAIRNYAFRISFGSIECLYQATEGEPIRAILNVSEGGGISSFRFNELSAIPKHEGSILCPARIGFAESGTLGTQTEWRLIFVRLVA